MRCIRSVIERRGYRLCKGGETLNTERLNILLIEDNPGDQRLIREMLVEAKHAEFYLEAVDRLSKGLARLSEAKVDLVLLDLSLPDSQGLDTFVTLRTAAKGIPIVVMSGLDDEKTAVESVQAGAQDYLIKGQVDGPLLIRSLRYAIERNRSEQERSQLLERERTARAEAEAANRAKDEFLAVVSHELRTPLNAMLGWSRMLRSGKLDEPTVGRGLDAIERNAKAQTRLIEDLLDLSRITTGKLRLDVRPVDLISVIENALDVVRPAAEAKGIHLQSTLDPDAGWVSGDPNRLQQIIWNLLTNAIKFNSKGGSVQVRFERIDSQAEITVSDTGDGISPEFLPHVFDRFRQADSSSTRKYGGLGLGLSIVRNLVELHGGTVQVDSKGEGQGTTFTVKLPLLASYAMLTPVEQDHLSSDTGLEAMSAPSLEGVRVLLVDDEADSREVITAMLIQYNAEVLAVDSAPAALEALKQWQPDVLLSDIEMPGEDGYSLLQKVRALDQNLGGQTPAAALTAYGRAEDRIRALEAGYQIHLPKPVESLELAAVIANLAGGFKPIHRTRDRIA
jgi:signal transduction histidine kinase